MSTAQHDRSHESNDFKFDYYSLVPILVEMEGVRFFIDLDNEDYWIEVRPDHSDLALALALNKIEHLGLELMDEEECPSTIDADGTVRTYLVEVIP